MNTQIMLNDGTFALVDAEDYPLISLSAWHAKTHDGGTLTYAASNTDPYGRRGYVKMHRVILAAPPGVFVDHINGNGLDNRKRNLRLCSQAENSRNRRKHSGRSLFKGVHPLSSGRWGACICGGNKVTWLGTFDTEEQAARAYDAAASKMYGDFARLNERELAAARAKIREGIVSHGVAA